jgi:tetratricopeptide (TPR) repeat protein
MTLNITVITKRAIIQSGDFRYTDRLTGKPVDAGDQQKIQLVIASRWSATVTFNGVARTGSINVAEWLANKISSIGFNDGPLERLFHELKTADDEWLRGVAEDNRHSFVVGAFDGSTPVYGIVSNYEQLRGKARRTADSELSIHIERNARARSYIAGQPQAVSQETRARLCGLAKVARDYGVVLDALIAANEEAAATNNAISKACCVTHLSRSGEAHSRCSGIEPSLSMTFLPGLSSAEFQKLLKLPLGARVIQTAAARASSDDDYHRTRLADHPHDPATHSNYGVYLIEKKRDAVGAEAAYREALRLDPKYVLALVNLGSLQHRENNLIEAEANFTKALTLEPAHEAASYAYASLLRKKSGPSTATKIVDDAVPRNPNSSRLVQLRAELTLMQKDYPLALTWLRRARECGCPQAWVELHYSVALQLSGAPIPECIAAYRTAVALNPDNGGAILNLSQVLLAIGAEEGQMLLARALQMELTDNARIEAHFYRFAHGAAPPEEVVAQLQELVSKGERMDWDVAPNIARVAKQSPRFGAVLKELAAALSSPEAPSLLEQWSRNNGGGERR